MSFLNIGLLFGLVAVSVPILIHLLNRRRYDVVDWAAMQFLQVSRRVRRKVLIEELLLLLLRMGLIALLVLAMAAPVLHGSWFAKLGVRPNRDMVLIFDGSASMSHGEIDAQARTTAGELLDVATSGDGVGVVWAGPVPVEVMPELRPNPAEVRERLKTIPEPTGSPDFPAALRSAMKILDESTLSQREIVILTDGQRYGWADERTLQRLELLAARVQADGQQWPRVWMVNVASEREGKPNWAIEALTTTRPVAVVGREVRFRTTLRLTGADRAKPPKELTVEIDGRPAGTVPVPGVTAGGQIAITFTRRFATAGSHLITVRIPDDALPADNRQDFALEVLDRIPVLIIDGDTRPNPKERPSDFLRDALDPKRDPSPAFRVDVASAERFEPGMLREKSVVILSDVARLEPYQQIALDRYIRDGGGLLVTLGERVDRTYYVDQLYRGGEGWLPARPIDTGGDLSDLESAPHPIPESFAHPAMEPMRGSEAGSLSAAYFPRSWTLRLPEDGPASAMAMLSDRRPLLIERAYGRGRVIVSAVPLDASWRTNLTRLPDFPRLAHELGYYLAGGRGGEWNLDPGQPIVFRPRSGEPPTRVEIDPPGGESYRISVDQWPAVIDQTQRPGAYRVRSAVGEVRYYVVKADPAESVLTPMNDEDRRKLEAILPTVRLTEDIAEVAGGMEEASGETEIWWLGMLAVMALLMGEIVFTRRMAKRG